MARKVSIYDRDYEYYHKQASNWRTRKRASGKHLLVCEHCGEGFYAARRDARYCSDNCRVAGNRAKQPKRKRAESAAAALETKRAQAIQKTCEVCGHSFWIDGTQTAQMYCGPACRQKAYRQRKN
jgi:hypothetical protein